MYTGLDISSSSPSHSPACIDAGSPRGLTPGVWEYIGSWEDEEPPTGVFLLVASSVSRIGGSMIRLGVSISNVLSSFEGISVGLVILRSANIQIVCIEDILTSSVPSPSGVSSVSRYSRGSSSSALCSSGSYWEPPQEFEYSDSSSCCCGSFPSAWSSSSSPLCIFWTLQV